LKKIIHISFICIVLISAVACKNDLQIVKQLCISDNSPIESGKNVEVIYSTDGQVDMMIKSPLLNRYDHENEPYTELPEGVLVYFYDSLMSISSSMTSKYAIRFDAKQMMEAKNDVVVINEAGEKLNTEHLIWDEIKGTIYSDKAVTITTEDEILFGEGFESDETFNQWIIKKPTGMLTVKEDEESEESEEDENDENSEFEDQ